MTPLISPRKVLTPSMHNTKINLRLKFCQPWFTVVLSELRYLLSVSIFQSILISHFLLNCTVGLHALLLLLRCWRF